MGNIVFNKYGDTTEVDILGDIGDSFFAEGNTLESVKAKFDQIDSTYLTINISSLGGLVSEGLAIHDLIKSYKGVTTARIIGWTASMGTIIALAADRTEISENSHFLIHNAWTGIVGNAADLRKEAIELDRIDRRLNKIYQRKTNRPEYEIAELMAEEKWLSPEEALQFGFVDSVSQSQKAAASINQQALVEAGLPKLPENLNSKYNEMKEQKENASLTEQFNDLKAWFVDKFQNEAEKECECAEAVDSKEVQEKLDEFDNKANELEEQIGNHETEVAELQETHEAEVSAKVSELEVANAKIEELEAKLAAKEAGEVSAKKDSETVVGEEAVLNQGQKTIKNILKTL